MIAASILLGRCLAPLEQAIGSWRGLVLARSAWLDLGTIEVEENRPTPIVLPSPKGMVTVNQVTVQPDPDQQPILTAIDLTLNPGEILAVLGPSGSGKSTLAQLLVGTRTPNSGTVRLDERVMTGWHPQQLGRHIGYLPQGVELLPGTIRDNIARFGETDDEAVIKAAVKADVDTLIRRLPGGYETFLHHAQSSLLSMGQRQRIGLARALFGDPRLLVFDEPNANLDTEGETALVNALRAARNRGATVVVITHRPNLIQIADKIAVLYAGELVRHGSRQEIMRPVLQDKEQTKTKTDLSRMAQYAQV